MLVAYILTKTGSTKTKIVRSGKSVFIWKGCEYQIDFTKKREKKFLGIKSFFWLMFEQDNPIPLDFDKGQIVRANQDIPINELAYFVNLLRGQMLIIIAIACIGALICSMLVLYFVFDTSENVKLSLAYLKEIYNLLKPEMVNPIIP
jgi:hypothetical protein